MRITKKIHKQWDTKIKTFFALFPVTVWHKEKREIRWLEKVTVKYQYHYQHSYWEPIQFIDK